MTTRIGKVLALLLAMVFLVSGCNLITVDPEKDAQTVVAEVGSEKILKGDAMKEYEDVVSYYAQYGMSGSEVEQELKQMVLDYMAAEKVKELKAKELGLDTITEADQEKAAEDAQTQYDEALSYYKMYMADDTLTDEELTTKVADYLAENGYTVEAVKEQIIESLWSDRLYENVTKDLTLTDEELNARYDEKVIEDKEQYAEAFNFEYAMINNEIVAYRPEGFRRVKHILLKLTDEQSEELSDLQSQLDDLNAEIEAAGEDASDEADLLDASEEGAEFEDADFDDSNVDAEEGTVEDPTAEPEATEAPEGTEATEAPEETAAPAATPSPEQLAKKAELEKQIDELKQTFMTSLQPKIDEVNAKIQAGEDFDALIEAYGEDPGMQEEPGKTNGYYVSSDSVMWESIFTETAMGLAKVGDVSEPVLGSNGVHIIKYVADVTSGAVPLEEIKDEISVEALDAKKEEAFDAAVEQWTKEMNVKTYANRMD